MFKILIRSSLLVVILLQSCTGNICENDNMTSISKSEKTFKIQYIGDRSSVDRWIKVQRGIDRIKIGMNAHEVVSILGCPDEDFRMKVANIMQYSCFTYDFFREGLPPLCHRIHLTDDYIVDKIEKNCGFIGDRH